MHLSLTVAFVRPTPVEEALHRLADAGYGGVELRTSDLPAASDARRVGAAARQCGLRLTVHGPQLGDAAATAAARSDLELATELGASLMVLHPAASTPGDEAAAWGRTFAGLDHLVPLAERLGTPVGVENMERRTGEVVNTPDDCAGLLERYRSTSFNLVVDFAHAATHGLVEDFLGLVDRADHLHMSDSSPEETHVARWGHGTLDVRRVLGELKSTGYRGAVVIEGSLGEEEWESAMENVAVWHRWTSELI